MQYLYVLTSNENDFYYEQFLMSATSLKMKMPYAEISLLCDSETKKNLTGKRDEYKKLITNIISPEAPASMSHIEVSRWLKTSMRHFVQGDFLFIDCDTVVADDLSSVHKLNITAGICLDKHCLISEHEKGSFITNNDKKLGFDSYLSNHHFNSGVIFCRDTPEAHKTFNRWHVLWLLSKEKNILRDQPALNMAIYENPTLFTELEGTWNCQIAYNGLPYLADSKIIHYFASDSLLQSSPFILSHNAIFNRIKDSGRIPDDVLEMLKNPRAAFSYNSRIIAGNNVLHVINSDIFQFIVLVRKKIPAIFFFYNFLASLVKKIFKFLWVMARKKSGNKTQIYN